jgi:hypothetical protein
MASLRYWEMKEDDFEGFEKFIKGLTLPIKNSKSETRHGPGEEGPWSQRTKE